jgi:hypothetical protein
MQLATLMVLMLSLATGPAAAYCSKPSAPSCATRYGSFDDEYEFDRCKREMEYYESEVESYLSCQTHEAEQIRSDNQSTINDYDDAVQSFNRRARS